MPDGAPGGGGSVSKDPSSRRPNPRAGDARPARHGTTQTPTHHNPETIITTIRHKLLTATVASAISAVAGFAPAAHAADVTLYGSIDTGILFQRVDTDRAGEDARNNVKMNSSSHTPNRWGLKGAEDLGNGLAVGFNLEGQLGATTAPW